jgi:hypothetical protein
MVIYWYCANIPPRPLDGERHKKGKMVEEKNFGPMGEKNGRKGSELDEILERECDERGRERETSRCGVVHADERGGEKTYERDDQSR